MRCKKHNTDLSSINGVCASCLRERLISVIIAQEQLNAQSPAQSHSNSNTNQQPYINRQKSDMNPVPGVQRPYNNRRLNHSLSDQRFYNSPQIAINTGGCIGSTSSYNNSSNKKKQSVIRFSSFSNLFRSNRDADSIPRVSASTSGEPSGAAGKPTSVASSPLWFSKKHKPPVMTEAAAAGGSGSRTVRKQRCVRDRGMSPVETSDDDGNEFSDGSSGYESVESVKQTPKMTPSHQPSRRRSGQRSVSEVIFCLSPLVRASPSRFWSMKGKPPVDGGGFAGEIRSAAAPHISNVKSFYANRSRKLADFGRVGPNR